MASHFPTSIVHCEGSKRKLWNYIVAYKRNSLCFEYMYIDVMALSHLRPYSKGLLPNCEIWWIAYTPFNWWSTWVLKFSTPAIFLWQSPQLSSARAKLTTSWFTFDGKGHPKQFSGIMNCYSFVISRYLNVYIMGCMYSYLILTLIHFKSGYNGFLSE